MNGYLRIYPCAFSVDWVNRPTFSFFYWLTSINGIKNILLIDSKGQCKTRKKGVHIDEKEVIDLSQSRLRIVFNIVTGSLGVPANNTFISDKRWKLKQTCHRFCRGQRRKRQCDFRADFSEALVKTSCLNVMRDLNFEPKAVTLWPGVQTLGTSHPFIVCCHFMHAIFIIPFRAAADISWNIHQVYLTCFKNDWIATQWQFQKNQAFTVALRGKGGRIAFGVLDTGSISTKSESRASQTSCKALLQKDGQFL